MLVTKLRKKSGATFIMAWFLVIWISVSCGCDDSTDSDTAAGYIIPEGLDDGWRVSSLTEQGIDESTITSLDGEIRRGTYPGVHALLIVKNDHLVFEAYYNGETRYDPHRLQSVGKSIGSALIGIAIDSGHIQDVNESITDLLPGYDDLDWSGGKDQITLQDILTMRSGLQWDEKTYDYSDTRNSLKQMSQTDDWVKFVLERPMTDAPGTHFVYSTGLTHMMAQIIKNRVGVTLDDYAQEHLFDPLDISVAYWPTSPQGNPCIAGMRGGLRLRARDLAKIGFLYHNDGEWNNSQVVPAAWVRESWSRQVEQTDRDAYYGYLWWERKFTVENQTINAWQAQGYGGQHMYMFDELDLVVVWTSGNYGIKHLNSQIREMMTLYVLPAVVP